MYHQGLGALLEVDALPSASMYQVWRTSAAGFERETVFSSPSALPGSS